MRETGTGGAAQPGAGASPSRWFTCSTNEIKGNALPTTKLVGQALEDHNKNIQSFFTVLLNIIK
jgi:disease resistance protein RPS2